VNFPLELFLDETVKNLEAPDAIAEDVGEKSKFVRPSGCVTVMVSALVAVTLKLSVLAPFFLMVIADLFSVKTVHPAGAELGTVPVLTAPQVPHGSSQVAAPVPATIASDETSFDWLTVEYVPGETVSPRLVSMVMSPVLLTAIVEA